MAEPESNQPSAPNLGRRQFLLGAAGIGVAGLGLMAAGRFLADASAPADSATTSSLAHKASPAGAIPTTTLGRRKIPITRIALGGWHYGAAMGEDPAVALLNRAFELGVTFFDTAHSYGSRGASERRLAIAFAGRRDRVVLMSKSTQRSASEAERELDESLARLGTDHLDLWQFHALTSPQDAESIVAPGGAIEAARRALADGRIRSLGATGHTSPPAMVRALELIPELEVIQVPVNCVDRHWKSFLDGAVPEARKRGVQVLAMKTLAMGMLTRAKNITVAECHRYALSQPIDAWVSGVISEKELLENLEVLRTHTPMSAEEQAELLERSRPLKGSITENYKTWGA